MLQLYYLFSELIQISFLVLDLLLELDVCLAVCLSFLHSTFHLLDKLSKLSILLVLLQESLIDLSVLSLHLTNHSISLLKLLFNDFKLLRVSKGVLAFDNFFKLMPEPCTFLHIQFDFDFNFRESCAADISFKGIPLLVATLFLSLELLNFTFQIYYQVSFTF